MDTVANNCCTRRRTRWYRSCSRRDNVKRCMSRIWPNIPTTLIRALCGVARFFGLLGLLGPIVIIVFLGTATIGYKCIVPCHKIISQSVNDDNDGPFISSWKPTRMGVCQLGVRWVRGWVGYGGDWFRCTSGSFRRFVPRQQESFGKKVHRSQLQD